MESLRRRIARYFGANPMASEWLKVDDIPKTIVKVALTWKKFERLEPYDREHYRNTTEFRKARPGQGATHSWTYILNDESPDLIREVWEFEG